MYWCTLLCSRCCSQSVRLYRSFPVHATKNTPCAKIELAQPCHPGSPDNSKNKISRAGTTMGTTLRQLMVTSLLLISCRVVNSVSWLPRPSRVKDETPVEETCPPCELLFTKLEDKGGDGRLTQHVKVQERGEPKSGTGLMYFWAIATFTKTCDYLKRLYGEERSVESRCANRLQSHSQEGRGHDLTGLDTFHSFDASKYSCHPCGGPCKGIHRVRSMAGFYEGGSIPWSSIF